MADIHQLRATLHELRTRTDEARGDGRGLKAVKELLASFGADKATDLNPDVYDTVFRWADRRIADVRRELAQRKAPPTPPVPAAKAAEEQAQAYIKHSYDRISACPDNARAQHMSLAWRYAVDTYKWEPRKVRSFKDQVIWQPLSSQEVEKMFMQSVPEEVKEPVAPVQGVEVGDSVHYTDADPTGGKFTPIGPIAATVVSVSKTTGKPTLFIMRAFPTKPGDANHPAVVPAYGVVQDAEFSDQPGGSMAARGCWSWRRSRHA